MLSLSDVFASSLPENDAQGSLGGGGGLWFLMVFPFAKCLDPPYSRTGNLWRATSIGLGS